MPISDSKRMHLIATIIAMSILYALVARLSLLLAFPGSNASALWPPSGLALAVVMIRGRKFLPAVFLGAFAANLWQLTGDLRVPAETAALLSAFTAAGNTLEALCGIALLKKLIVNPLSAFDSSRNSLVFAFSALLSCLASAAIGPAALCYSGTAPWPAFPGIFFTWLIGDMVGMFTVTPLIILWYFRNRDTLRARWMIEAVAAMVMVCAATAFLFGGDLGRGRPVSLEYLLLPVLLVVSYRLGQRAAVTAVAFMSAGVVLFTVNGLGPYANASPGFSLVLVQGFTGSVALTMIVLTSRSREIEASTVNLKSATEYLLSATEYAENLIATANSLIVVINLEGKITLFNQAAEGITGYGAGEVIGKRWPDVFPPPEAGPDVWSEFLRITGDGAPGKFECELTHRGGESRYIRWQNNLVRQNNQAVGALYFGQDITEGKSMERALEKSEAKLQALFGSLTAGIFVLDGNGKFMSCNQRWADMLGYTVDEILGLRNTDVVHPDAHPDANLRLGQLVTGKVREYQDVRKFIRRDGSVMWGLLSVSKLSGTDDQFMMTVMDINERMRSEKELRETKERLEYILGITKTGIDVIDAECNIRYIDPESAKRYGDPAGRKCHEYFKGMPDRCSGCMLPETLKNKAITVHEETLPDQGGRVLEVHSIPFRDYEGEWLITEFNLDITDRKRTEQELEKLVESERKLTQTVKENLERISDAFVSLDTGWRYTYMNKKAGEIFNRDPDKMIGRHIWTEFPEGVGQPFQFAYERAMREQRFILLEEYYPPYDRWFENHIYPSQDGLSIFFHDITERKKAEIELHRSRNLLQAMLDASLDAVTVTDEQGVFLASNRVLQMRWGRTNEEIIGHSASEVLPPDVFAGRVERIRQTIATGAIDHFLDEYGGRIFENTLAPIVEKDAVINNVVMYSRDITERERAKKDLQRSHDELELRVLERTRELTLANERLKELDRMKSKFLATMSHELRTPMNSIIGFTGILQQGLTGPLNDEQKKQIGIVYNSARHLLNLINDLLDLSRIEAGKVTIDNRPFNFSEVISEVVEFMGPMAEQKRLAVRTEPPGRDLTVTGDRKRCLQVLLNLVNNAVKFTQAGEIRIAARIEGGRLVASVSDTGIGIKDEQKGMLFEAFRQLDDTAKRVYEGTGLGLHLCRKLLDLMGGEIHFESTFGRGSTFTFTVPAHGRDETTGRGSTPS